MILIIGLLFILVAAGVIMALGSSVINWTFDEVVPEIDSIGQIEGSANMTEVSRMTLHPLNTVVQNFTWITALIYIFGILAVFGIAFAFRGMGDRWLIALFISMVLILIIGCIIFSNIYEAFYTGTDEIALLLQEHTLLSYLILYSPLIFSLVAFVAGIILFSGDPGGRT